MVRLMRLLVLLLLVSYSNSQYGSARNYGDIITNVAAYAHNKHDIYSQDNGVHKLESLRGLEHFLTRDNIQEYATDISEFIKHTGHNDKTRPERYVRSAQSSSQGNRIASLLQSSTLSNILKGVNISSADILPLLSGITSSMGGSSSGIPSRLLSALLPLLQDGDISNIIPTIKGLLPLAEKLVGNNKSLLEIIQALESNPQIMDMLQKALTSKTANNTISMLQSVNLAFSKAPAQCRNDLSFMFSAIGNGDIASLTCECFYITYKTHYLRN